MSYRFADSLRAGSGWNSVHSKNKFEKLVHLVGFIIRNNNNILTSTYHVWGTPSPLTNGYKVLCARKLEQQSMKLAAQVL